MLSLFLAWICLWPLAAAADNATLVLQRGLFIAADKALQLGNRTVFEQSRARLADYPLYPYLVYRDVHERLETASGDEIQAFLNEYAATPLASRLRSVWLRQLGKQQRWPEFIAFYQSSAEVTLDCLQRQALLAGGQQAAALQDIESVWVYARSRPAECDPVFAVWREQGGFTPQRVWRRFELALAEGQTRLARYLSGLLPAAEKAQAELWLRVHDNPQQVLDTSLFTSAGARRDAILFHGLWRWSRRDSVAASHALDTLEQRYQLPADQVAPLRRQLALYLASRGHPEALQRLSELPSEQVDEQVEEWRVRVGLQLGDWQLTLRWLERMSPALADSLQWRYWRARALASLGRGEEALTIYRDIAQRRDYHGFLAAARLGLPYQLEDKVTPVPEKEVDELAASVGMQRAHELFVLKREYDALAEWRQVTAEFSPEDWLVAAYLAHRWGWHYQAIAAATQAKAWNHLQPRFPLPYRAQVSAYARAERLDPAWIYAVMRQESLFRNDARSHAGALGLMQIMPATGNRIARGLSVSLPNRQALYIPDTNIRFGAYYLRYTLDRLQDNPMLATAAYNAGPQRVLQWLPGQGAIEPDIWAETIPFSETRQYVKRVMEYATVYAQLLGRETSTLERLAAVQSVMP